MSHRTSVPACAKPRHAARPHVPVTFGTTVPLHPYAILSYPERPPGLQSEPFAFTGTH